MMDMAMAAGADGDDDEYEDDETGGSGMAAPFLSMGPGGFGGFAPRKPVVMNGDQDDEQEMGSEMDDDEEDGDGDDYEDEDEEMEMEDEGLRSIERMKDDIYADEEEDAPQKQGEENGLRPSVPLADNISQPQNSQRTRSAWQRSPARLPRSKTRTSLRRSGH